MNLVYKCIISNNVKRIKTKNEMNNLFFNSAKEISFLNNLNKIILIKDKKIVYPFYKATNIEK